MNKTYIENSAAGAKEATMRLYGIIGKKVDGDVFAQELASLDALGLDQINIRGNTLGGDVIQGMSIVSAVVSTRTPVVFHVDGIVASMGAIIAAASDEVVMMDYARMMIHDPFFAGDDGRLSLKHKKLLAHCKEMLQMVLSRRGKDVEEVADLMKAETWFSAQEAKAAGLCDRITTSAKADLINMAPLQLVATIEADYESSNNFKDKMEKITLTAEATVALGLRDSAQEPDAISAAIVKMKADHKIEVDGVKNELAEFKQKQEEARKAEAATLVDAAVKEGRITADMKETYIGLCEKDFDGTKKILASLGGKTKLSTLTGRTGSSVKYADKTWDELDKGGLLASLKADDPDLYAQKYAEMAATLKIAKN